MQFNGKTAIAALAAVTSIQLVPAPFLAAIPAAVATGLGAVSGVVGAAAGVAGTVIAGVNSKREIEPEFFSRMKRQDYGTEQAWNDCHGQLGGATLTFSSPEPAVVLVQGIPSACMTLLTTITGNFNEGNPVPQGTDSATFTNLSDAAIQEIQDALDTRA